MRNAGLVRGRLATGQAREGPARVLGNDRIVTLRVRSHRATQRRVARVSGNDEPTRAAKGTGIGLALVKELVEAMGARIDARNAPGGGLRVAVRLSPTTASP